MRVLMLSWEYPPYMLGGIGKHVAELIPALARLGRQHPDFALDLVTSGAGGGPPVEQMTEQVTIHRLNVPPLDPNDLYNSVIDANRAFEGYSRVLGEQTPFNLVHVHDWLTASAGIALKQAWKVPLVATIHATERGRHHSNVPNSTSWRIDRMEWELCYEAWRVIVCSGFMAGELSGFFDVPLDKVSVIPNGVDPAPLQNCPEEELEHIRQTYAPGGEKLLFFVGRITPEKGVHRLIEAIPLILRKHPDVRVLIAGKNSETLQPEVDALGIGHVVTLLGFISDEERNCIYNAVDAAIFPSLYEPFGIVALEALAAGCNVIASDVGGLGEIVHHQQNGLTVLANNAASIAWAVDTLFEDPEQAAAWRRTALEQVRTLYAWPEIAEHTYALYQSVVEERKGVDW